MRPIVALAWRWLLPLLLAWLTFAAPASVSAEVPANGRVWELVSPGETLGAVIDRAVGIGAGGNRIAYQSFGSIPGAPAGEAIATSLAVRTASGWESTPQGVPIEVPIASLDYLASPRVVAFDAGLSSTVRVSNVPLVPGGPEAGRTGIYRLEGGVATLLASVEESAASPFFLGASDDLSHVLFQSDDHLLPSDLGRTSGKSIYEQAPVGLRQVDVDSAGSLLSACGSSVTAVDGISDSAQRIFFANPVSVCGGLSRRLYLRQAGSVTVEVSASHCTRVDCNAPQDVDFQRATPDGSVVFFATAQQLVDEDEDELRDLYRYDVEAGSLELVSARSPGETGVVQGEVRTSADGSRVYFQADGRLLPDLGGESERNLYMADAAGLHFVATTGDAKPLLVSHDGGVALFATTVSLESADADENADAYLYDAAADELTRVSAGADGNGPFDVELAPPVSTGGGAFDIRIDAPFGGSLSADGDRVFFTTEESLLPEDRNGATDVYEWAGGVLGLISSGEGDDGAQFAGATADGRTALFRTSASLLPEDRDGGDHDLYAARIGGGFPPVPTQLAGCDACAAAADGTASRPSTATTTAPASPGGRLRVGRPGDRAGVHVLSSGFLPLRVGAPRPGKVVATAQAQLGGRYRAAARGVAGATRPGQLTLRLDVSGLARRALRRRGALRLRLVVRQADLRAVRQLELRVARSR